jgi:DUF2993 family protein
MPISSIRLGMALSSAYAALMFGSMHASAATPPVTEAREWRYEMDAGSLSQSMNAWAASGGAIQTPLGAARLQELTAEISNNELIVRGTASTGWLSVPVDAAATAWVQSGNVQVQVVNAHINGIDVPDVARGQLEQQVQNQVTQSVAGSGVVVRSVQLGDGKLAVGWVGP